MAYPSGAADPHFTYNVKPVFSEDIESLKLTIDGQTADFTPASPAKAFTWQVSGAHGVQLSGKFKGGTDFQYPTYDGLWAVFEWVGDADAQQGSTLEWRLKAGKSRSPGALARHQSARRCQVQHRQRDLPEGLLRGNELRV